MYLKALLVSVGFLMLMSPVNAQLDKEVKVMDYNELEEYLPDSKDQLVYVNFWATWCKPCVQEMPYFNEFSRKFAADDKVKVILVSLDFPSQLESRLLPFIEERSLHPEVILLDDPDANSWIDRVHPTWSGAIPATLVYQGKKKKFYEKSFHSVQELEDIYQTF
jgi:thiol-disulfide isomerase/thioredoxin